MPAKSPWGSRDFCVPPEMNVADADDSAFAPLTAADVREAFAVPATHPPILSLDEAAELVKLRPQTLKRKISEGLYAKSVVRGSPSASGGIASFWR